MRLLLRRCFAVAAVLLILAIAVVALITWRWQTRPLLAELPIPYADSGDSGDANGEQVTVTWLGISTLLFDDGETQILTDATFSRPKLHDLLLFQPLESDYATINRALDEFHIDRLAAIIPLHSHFDHVMDAGHVANRTDAMVLGSGSTSNVARGSRVPVDQYQTLKTGEPRFFGDFTVTLLESRHVPQLPNGNPIFSGVITKPLVQPAPVSAWHSDFTYTVLIEHPTGKAIVQGSAGFVADQLNGVTADAVFLSIAGLATQGKAYAEEYWREIVLTTGARRVYPIHFDDFTFPLGEVALFPAIVDDIVVTAGWINEFAAAPDEKIEVGLPVFGKPLRPFSSLPPQEVR
ncbi:MAG: MBL fold metallo-hydrolase [Woeseia sp.]|nr:MBL fold metallo-hydrolase [Woeseia sp.]